MNREWIDDSLYISCTINFATVQQWVSKGNGISSCYKPKFERLPVNPLQLAEGVLYMAAGLRPAWIKTDGQRAYLRMPTSGYILFIGSAVGCNHYDGLHNISGMLENWSL